MAKFTAFASKSPFDGQAVEFRLKSRSKPITGLFRFFVEKQTHYVSPDHYKGSFINEDTGEVHDMFATTKNATNWRAIKKGVQSKLEYLSVEQLSLFPAPVEKKTKTA